MKLAAGLLSAVLAGGLAAGVALGADLDPQLAQAVALRHAARTDEAISRLQRLAAERPGDADVQLHLGLALEVAGRRGEAREALLACLRLAPDYSDARVALARIERGEAAPSPWRVDVSAAYSRLSGGLPPWRSSSLAVSRTGVAATVTGSVEASRRFSRTDVYAEAMVLRPLRGRADVYAAVGGAPDADHRPKLAVRAGGTSPAMPLGAGVTAQLALDAAWARYPAGEVTSAHPAVVLSKGDQLSLAVRSYNVIDEQQEHRSGWGVQGAWAASPRLTLRAGWADAPESSEGRTVEVKAANVGAEWRVDERTALRIDGVREDRDAYDRDEVSLGLARRF